MKTHCLSGYINNLITNNFCGIFILSVYVADFSIARKGKIENRTWRNGIKIEPY